MWLSAGRRTGISVALPWPVRGKAPLCVNPCPPTGHVWGRRKRPRAARRSDRPRH
jgi:hypothetical protein